MIVVTIGDHRRTFTTFKAFTQWLRHDSPATVVRVHTMRPVSDERHSSDRP